MVIPSSIQALFDGHDVAAKDHVAAILATVDEEGWPHLSFLSVGEVLVTGEEVALTLWAPARSVAALRLSGRAALFAAADGVVHEIRLDVAEPPPVRDTGTVIARCRAVSLREHAAPYATVSGLIGFDLADPAASRQRWERQIGDMRDHLPGR